ncbi:MAG: Fic family protein [Thermoplasmatales archaeon]|nr:Fic family protein [Thermoplasmatales archaeon]MCW6170334.1 Fic family protein [Thermoplasmatales archaeon]
MDRYILNRLRERLLDRGSIRNMPEKTLKESFIVNTWGTNTIEGNTLTLKEVTRVIESGMTVPNRPIRHLMETIQHASALAEVVKGNISEINMKNALELHNIIFHGILIDAGQWRKVNVQIYGSRYSPPRVEKLLSLLQKWVEKYVENELARDDVFHQAAEMHFGFESIHPFSDGNGRVGRLLLNIHFLNHNWPLINILPHDRAAYLNALEIGHSNGLDDLTKFLENNMASSLVFLLDKVGSSSDKLMTLQQAKEVTRIDYSIKYMALRINQGELPGFRWNNVWHTSPEAIKVYREIKGR